MGHKKQLASGLQTDAGTSQPIGEGYLLLSTSAGNILTFRSPAERDAYRLNNRTQISNNNGELDTRGN